MDEMSHMEPRKVRILDSPVHVTDRTRAVEYLARQIDRGVKQFVIAQNPEKLMWCLRDKELSNIGEHKATLLIPDGVGLAISRRILGLEPIPQLTGIGLFFELLALADVGRKRVFLYGSTPDVCVRAGKTVEGKYPGIALVGTQHGYEGNEALVLQRICRATPDFLFVALGSPKQEKWIAKHLDQLPILCAMGVGGSFDVLAGKVRRAPVFIQRAGLEWLYRLMMQPTRARRILALPSFLWMVLKSRSLPAEQAVRSAPDGSK
jgi:N-acetylglucosaminyldiphosphoundecaprenol N-acetyl-beta-D-mannosaminyltransferase